MNSVRIKTALKHVVGWSLAALFLTLLTVIFSFLGALFCAALGGMLMGASRTSKGLSLLYSVFCPGILLTVMRTQATELAGRQVGQLAGLCLVTFWSLYALAALLVAYEQKEREAQAARAGVAAAAEPAGALAAAAPEISLQLDALEGHWCCDACGANGRTQRRILQIRNGAAELSTLDAEGHVCSCARGRLNLVRGQGANGAGPALPAEIGPVWTPAI
jgi:hypothetical protein